MLVADNTTIPPEKKIELDAEASGELNEERPNGFSAEANGPGKEFDVSPGEADISFPPLPEPSPSDHVASGILVKNDVKYIVIGQGNQTVGQIANTLKYSIASLLDYKRAPLRKGSKTGYWYHYLSTAQKKIIPWKIPLACRQPGRNHARYFQHVCPRSE